MNYYETVIIFHPDLSDEELEKQVEAVRERLEGGGAEIADCENWGKRRLAYGIRTQRYGFYILIRYNAPPHLVPEIENPLRINEQVLKFLTVRCRPGEVTPPDLLKEDRGRAEEAEVSGSRPTQEGAPPAEASPPEEDAKTAEEAEPVSEEPGKESEA